MNKEIKSYNKKQAAGDKETCDRISSIIDLELNTAESKIWHAHPVWFLDGNPIVGYGKQKAGIRLMFWSGADFQEEGLNVVGSKFKDASIVYTDVSEIKIKDLKRWIQKSRAIQYDYKNIVKRKGKLEPLVGIGSTTSVKSKSPYGAKKFKTIDEYHASAQVEFQKKLNQLRQAIKQAAPRAEEVISYNMPAFMLNKVLVYYAAHKEHIGFYPTASPIVFFKSELSKYNTSKGAIQFPLNKPLPTSLIKKIVKFRNAEVVAKLAAKKQKTKR